MSFPSHVDKPRIPTARAATSARRTRGCRPALSTVEQSSPLPESVTTRNVPLAGRRRRAGRDRRGSRFENWTKETASARTRGFVQPLDEIVLVGPALGVQGASSTSTPRFLSSIQGYTFAGNSRSETRTTSPHRNGSAQAARFRPWLGVGRERDLAGSALRSRATATRAACSPPELAVREQWGAVRFAVNSSRAGGGGARGWTNGGVVQVEGVAVHGNSAARKRAELIAAGRAAGSDGTRCRHA